MLAAARDLAERGMREGVARRHFGRRIGERLGLLGLGSWATAWREPCEAFGMDIVGART
jgi:phosphoglycerate dehydrogenase-like enzyme